MVISMVIAEVISVGKKTLQFTFDEVWQRKNGGTMSFPGRTVNLPKGNENQNRNKHGI